MTVAVAIALALMQAVDPAQGSAEVTPPQPAATTRATFLSETSDPWDVLVDDQAMCATPCSGPLNPLQFVVMRSHEVDPLFLEVGRLPPGDLIVTASPGNHGMYAGGIVATTLGGMALATGIAFTAVGLAKDKSGMTLAGLVTSAVGAITLPGGIYLILKGLPDVSIEPAGPRAMGVAAGVGGAF